MRFELEHFSVLKFVKNISLQNAPIMLWNKIFLFIYPLVQQKYTFSEGKFHKESKNEVILKVGWCARGVELVKKANFVGKKLWLEVSIFSYHYTLCPKRHHIWVPQLKSSLKMYTFGMVPAIVFLMCKDLRDIRKMRSFLFGLHKDQSKKLHKCFLQQVIFGFLVL